MAWFRCLIRGEDFPGQLIGEQGLVGFYVTRIIEAADPNAVESAALAELRGESKLAPRPGYKALHEPRIFFEEIEKIVDDRVPDVSLGFAWYPMEDVSP